MTAVNWRTVLASAVASFMFLAVTTGAQAHDWRGWKHERWEHERWEHRHHFVPPGHRYHYERSRRVVYEQQPVMVMPVPVYPAPDYSQPMGSSLNFNFTIPLQ